MRQLRSYGSVGAWAGNRPFYPVVLDNGLQQPLHAAAGGPALALPRFSLFRLAAHCLRLT